MTSQTRLFHVLPKLYRGSSLLAGFIKTKHVSLDVFSSDPDISVEPLNGKIRITRPLPNKGYFVGGDGANRLGWFVPLPEAVDKFSLVFLWKIHVPEIDYRIRIEHLIRVGALHNGTAGVAPGMALDNGEMKIWTMDVMPWCHRDGFYQEEPPVNVQPASRFSVDEIHPVRKARSLGYLIEGFPKAPWDESEVVGYEENLVIPPVSEKEFASQWLGACCGIASIIPPVVQEDV